MPGIINMPAIRGGINQFGILANLEGVYWFNMIKRLKKDVF